MRNVSKIILAILILTSTAFAFPRFAAKYNQKCALCHVNPTGCGMRNIYGSQFFAQNDLPVHKTDPGKVAKFNLSDFLLVGMDARTIYIYEENSERAIFPYVPNGKLSSFFQMEGDFYIDAQVTDRLAVFLKKGIYSEFEVYGLGNYLPYDGYVKIGKFQPSYGWRFQDHSSFVRDGLGWYPYYYDTGVEAGIYPSSFSANLGFFNGSSGQFDNDRGKAVAARFEYRKPIGLSGFGVGGSYWRNDMEQNAIDMYGPFFYINLLSGRLVHLGEFDRRKTKRTDITEFATTQSLSYLLTRGIWLEADYDYYDPDIDIKSGTVRRYSFHFDYFPIGYVELEPTARYYNDDIINENYTQLLMQAHFFF
jgi:hypothetical protein